MNYVEPDASPPPALIGERVTISGATGDTALNGTRYIKWTLDTKFELYSDEALTSGVATAGTYDASTATVEKPTFFDLEQDTALVTSCRTFGGQAQIGTGSADFPRIVYRLTEAKTFFNSGKTARRGLYSTYALTSNYQSDSQCSVATAVLSGADGGYFQADVFL